MDNIININSLPSGGLINTDGNFHTFPSETSRNNTLLLYIKEKEILAEFLLIFVIIKVFSYLMAIVMILLFCSKNSEPIYCLIPNILLEITLLVISIYFNNRIDDDLIPIYLFHNIFDFSQKFFLIIFYLNQITLTYLLILNGLQLIYSSCFVKYEANRLRYPYYFLFNIITSGIYTLNYLKLYKIINWSYYLTFSPIYLIMGFVLFLNIYYCKSFKNAYANYCCRKRTNLIDFMFYNMIIAVCAFYIISHMISISKLSKLDDDDNSEDKVIYLAYIFNSLIPCVAFYIFLFIFLIFSKNIIKYILYLKYSGI